ncbi:MULTISPECIES: tRNA (adenosine(37)-N6)-threonylcarbamoyltransferase complex dimerization subunit type 1 TsaB [Spirulina sp. CCY15215]|uniref:tRNA (adenosine(37)-N6)-threonylcarbamoyltransferase complex dimerization subunit type 1 TsaB n=1 Tax=Spirulina sp. CCY15215 TaxID=2767591 RepID=UPI00194E41E9|nr:tRNA (adenosine(37)-N6)-threonylcarbamoyltransferase complex dimerization subunit type 1 TsaB [Spirulina major]
MLFDSPQTYALALHTTSSQLGLAIDNFSGDSRDRLWNLQRELSTHLHSHLADFIQPQTWADLAFLAVAKGPGSFTSTRIGLVTARTLAQQLDRPLFAISSLAGFAWSQKELFQPGDRIMVEYPGKREAIFSAIYQFISDRDGFETILPDGVMTLEQWQKKQQDLDSSAILLQVPLDLGQTANSILELAALAWKQGDRPHWSQALPFYGQHPVNS